jgi:hypothetical protein
MLISFSSSYNSIHHHITIHHKKNITIIQLRFITRENHKKIRKKILPLVPSSYVCLPVWPPGAPRRPNHPRRQPGRRAGQDAPGAGQVAAPPARPPPGVPEQEEKEEIRIDGERR